MGFYFFEGPWENSSSPTIVMDDPNGGDYVIIATISSVFRPDQLHDMCARANSIAVSSSVTSNKGKTK